MKRIWIYLVILIGVMLIPERGQDAGKLQPVGLVFLYNEGEQLVMETDTGDIGVGTGLEEAFQNLEDTTPGVIFLDTADYLLVTEETQPLLAEMCTYMNGSTKVCLAQRGIDPAEAILYLGVHEPKTELGTPDIGAELDRLEYDERVGKFYLKICN